MMVSVGLCRGRAGAGFRKLRFARSQMGNGWAIAVSLRSLGRGEDGVEVYLRLLVVGRENGNTYASKVDVLGEEFQRVLFSLFRRHDSMAEKIRGRLSVHILLELLSLSSVAAAAEASISQSRSGYPSKRVIVVVGSRLFRTGIQRLI